MENVFQLKTNRSLVKTILLTIVTCGIYNLVFYSGVSNDINMVASRRDGKKTMHYLWIRFILAPVTCGIADFVWSHRMAARIGDEARERGIETDFGSATFWLWRVLGAFIIVGPFIYVNRLCNIMNEINADYNQKGM